MVVTCLVVTGGSEGVGLYGIAAILVGILVNERLMNTVLRRATFSMNGTIDLRLKDICKRYCTITSTFGRMCVVCRGTWLKMQLHRLCGSVCSISNSISDSNISAYPTQVNRRNSFPPTTDQFLIHIKTSKSSLTSLVISYCLFVEAQFLVAVKAKPFHKLPTPLSLSGGLLYKKVQTTSPDIYTWGGLHTGKGPLHRRTCSAFSTLRHDSISEAL